MLVALCERSRRQQPIELGRRIGFAILVGDDDLPAFARPDPRLGRDDQRTLSFDLHRLVVAFCDHLVGQRCSPARFQLAACWQRALAAIRREHDHFVQPRVNRRNAESIIGRAFARPVGYCAAAR
jgi:hypothetical protein